MSNSGRDKVVEIIAELAVLEPSDISEDQSLEDLGVDSLGLVESIFAIAEAFEIDVPFNANAPDQSDFDISTVGSIITAVDGLIQAKKG